MKYLIVLALSSLSYAKLEFSEALNQVIEEQKQHFLNDYILAYYGFRGSISRTKLTVEDVIRRVANKNNLTYDDAKSIIRADLILKSYQQLESLSQLKRDVINFQVQLNELNGKINESSKTYKTYQNLKTMVENYDLDRKHFELDKILQIFAPFDFKPTTYNNNKTYSEVDRCLTNLKEISEKRSAGVIVLLNSLLTHPENQVNVEEAKKSDYKTIIEIYKKFGITRMNVNQIKLSTNKEQSYDLVDSIINKTIQAKLNFLSEYIALHLGNQDFQKFSNPQSANEYIESYSKNYIFHGQPTQNQINAVKLGYLLEIARRIHSQEEYEKKAVRLQIAVERNGGTLNSTSREFRNYRDLQSELDNYYEAVIEEQIPIDPFIQSFAPLSFVPHLKEVKGGRAILKKYLRKLNINSQKRLAGMITLMKAFLSKTKFPVYLSEARYKSAEQIYKIIKKNIEYEFPELRNAYSQSDDTE